MSSDCRYFGQQPLPTSQPTVLCPFIPCPFSRKWRRRLVAASTLSALSNNYEKKSLRKARNEENRKEFTGGVGDARGIVSHRNSSIT